MKDYVKSFGVPLRLARRLDGHSVPYVVEKVLDYLQANALDTEGLFRVPGDVLEVNKLKLELDEAPENVDLSRYDNNSVAEVLKKFFGELPEPLVPILIDQHVKALFVGERKTRDEVMREIKFAVDSLAEDGYALLERLTDFMAVLVSFASRNKMNLANLAACIAPTLKFTPAIFTYCIQYHAFFFGTASPQIPIELVDMATTVEDRETEKVASRRDTPNVSVPTRTVQLVSDPNYQNKNLNGSGHVSPKDISGRKLSVSGNSSPRSGSGRNLNGSGQLSPKDIFGRSLNVPLQNISGSRSPDFSSGRDSVREYPSGRDSVREISGRDSVRDYPGGRDSVREYTSGRDSVREYGSGRDSVREHPSGRDSVREHPSGRDSVREYPSGRDSVREYPSGRDSVREYPSGRDSVRESPSGRDSVREPARENRDGAVSDSWSVDTPRAPSDRENSLQERRVRDGGKERDRDRDRGRDREKERDRDREEKGKEQEREKEGREKESSEARHARRKSRRASPSHHQSSEEGQTSGQETGANSDAIGTSRSSRHRHDPRAESNETGKRSGNGTASESEERQQKKKYYKEELAKLQKTCEFWKNEAQVHKTRSDEMTDKNFDLESQLKKQKLKNKELLLDIEMLEHKLRRVGIEVHRTEAKDDKEDKREEKKDEKKEKEKGGEGVPPPPSSSPTPLSKISASRRRSVSLIDPNDITGMNANGTASTDYKRHKRRESEKRATMSSPESPLHEHRSQSSSHIDSENKRSERRSTYIPGSSRRADS